MIHHTKTLGDLGVLKVQCNLYEQGYIPCIPLTEHAPYDLVACNERGCKKIQVKTRSLKEGKLSIPFKSCWSDRHGTHSVEWDKNTFDLVAVYCPETDLCYYFDHNDFGKGITLRVETPKNNQKDKVNFANDYLRVP